MNVCFRIGTPVPRRTGWPLTVIPHFPCLCLSLLAALGQLCWRRSWLFIHPLIVLIRDSNYPLRSSDYRELLEGDWRV